MPEMPDDELRNAVHAIVARLQADFETHLAALEQRHETSRAEIRRQTEDDVQARLTAEWSGKLDSARQDWQKELAQSLVEATTKVREEMEQAAVLSTTRLRAELEESSAQSTIHLREQMEEALTAERARVEAEIAAARTRLSEEIAADQQRLAADLESERTQNRALATQLDEARAALASEQQARQAAETALAAEQEARREAEASVAAGQQAHEATKSALTSEQQARQAAEAAVAAATQAREAAETAATTERQAREAAETAAATEREARHALAAELESQRSQVVEAASTEALAEERVSRLAAIDGLLSAVRAISDAKSLTDTLSALATSASSVAPRVALFILNDRAGHRELQGWRASGFGDPSPVHLRLPADDGGLLATAAASRTVLSSATVSAPTFAALPASRAALAVPITVGGKSVAVLYADDGLHDEQEAPTSWPEAVQILGAHASVCLSHITAVRTTQAMRASGGSSGRTGAAASEDDSGARRYARLLVSEIKLYNETAVRAGREKRDLLQRLGPEIERARKLYEERVSPSVAARATYFHEELVHTLADGDAALLGSA